jgi:hypothetical protein
MIAPMLDDWLGELAFVHYWRVLEEHGCGVMKAPEFTHLSLAERQAWIEAAKAIEEQVRGSSWLTSSLDVQPVPGTDSPILFNAQGDDRIHARRAARRNVTGYQRGNAEHYRNS